MASKYAYKTLQTETPRYTDSKHPYELQEKYTVAINGQRIVVSYRIKNGDRISKSYFSKARAINAFVDAYMKDLIRK
jgi:hypothetical protein